MKYFLDTEFIERFVYMYEPGKQHEIHTVIPISIGIVAEDGREYYAINRDCQAELADDWVKKNVIRQLPNNWLEYPGEHGDSLRKLNPIYKTKEEIRADLLSFAPPEEKPEFWAYYADYDWVTFCQLFGRMIDLPKGYPMYCRDLKQWLDGEAGAYAARINEAIAEHVIPFERALQKIKEFPQYPPQSANAHNALEDARWNRELHDFIKLRPWITSNSRS